MFSLLVSALLWTTTASSASYLDPQSCPSTPICICKWSGGKEVADCSNRGLVQIPSTLGNNIQSLILDGNPLKSLKGNAFKSVGLSNLQTLSLRGCQLTRVENDAFRELKVLQDIDLSRNNLTGIGTDVFDGNENLRTIRITHNPISRLEPFQFPRLNNLKRIDLSSCRVSTIDRMAFKNLGVSVHSINLDNNRLRSIVPEPFVPLTSLRNLQLHGNPWVCDCNLRNFRDWLVDNDLYGRPTRCSEPARLTGKTWDEIRTGDFACRPSVYSPTELVFGSPGSDVTLACRISGSPTPSARWVVKGRIINNHTRTTAFSNPTWIIHEDIVPDGGFGRWYNLTIVDPGHDNLGDYICVAENTAGVMEGRVTLTFDDPAIYGTGNDEDDGLIVGAATASVCFLLLALLIICYCFYLRRRKRGKTSKTSAAAAAAAAGRGDKMFGNESGVALLPYGGGGGSGGSVSYQHHRSAVEYQGLLSPEESDSLLMPIHRQHIMTTTLPHSNNNEVELRQFRAGSVTSTAQTTPRPQTSSSGEGSCHSNSTTNAEKSPQPDLIRPMMKKTSTPMVNLNASSLMMMRQGQPSPVPSTISSVAAASPFQRSGTLPVQYIYNNPSCQTLGRNISSSPEVVGCPSHLLPLLNVSQRQQLQRPGYVTLPRRPRNHRDSPSPALLYLTLNRSNRASPVPRNPVYDGVGPRTSADGSSRHNLNKPIKKLSAPPVLVNSVAGKRTSFSSTSGLPPPIDEELQENGFSIDKNLGNSTPNILSVKNEDRLNGTNRSAGNLNGNVTATTSSQLTLPEAEEENASGYFEPFGKAELPEVSEKEPEVAKKFSSMPRKPSGVSAKSDGFRPIPPPKPRQRLGPGQVRKQYQDEGVDGSEV